LSFELDSVSVVFSNDMPKIESASVTIPENQWVQEYIKPSVEDVYAQMGFLVSPKIEEVYARSGYSLAIDIFGSAINYKTRGAYRASDISPINFISDSSYGIFSKMKLVFFSYAEYNTKLRVYLDEAVKASFYITRSEKKYELDMDLSDGQHSISFESEAFMGNITIYTR